MPERPLIGIGHFPVKFPVDLQHSLSQVGNKRSRPQSKKQSEHHRGRKDRLQTTPCRQFRKSAKSPKPGRAQTIPQLVQAETTSPNGTHKEAQAGKFPETLNKTLQDMTKRRKKLYHRTLIAGTDAAKKANNNFKKEIRITVKKIKRKQRR